MKPSRFNFRVWHTDLKKMDKAGVKPDGDVVCWRFSQNILCDENIVLMQSTGLSDSTGREIFEGDIVSYKEYHRTRAARGVVRWSNSAWRVGARNFHYIHGGTFSIHVTGNIYERGIA